MVTPRILITRLSAIGDCIQTLALTHALRRAWPDASITWLVDCGAEPILRSQANIDEVIRLKKGYLKRPREVWQLRRTLREKQFDFCLDPQGLLKSSLLSWLSHATTKIGFSPAQAREQAWRLYDVAVEPNSTHLVDRQLELLRPLDIDTRFQGFGWTQPLEFDENAASILVDCQLNETPFFVLNPGAGWASKRWSIENFRQAAAELTRQHRIQCLVVWGDSSELEYAKSIAEGLNHIHVAPSTTLMTLAGILRRALFYLGGDTGPMHLSAAVETPCIAMFGTTLAERCGPYGKNHIRLQKEFDDGPSNYRRSTTNRAVMKITPADVIDAAGQLLGNSQPPAFGGVLKAA